MRIGETELRVLIAGGETLTVEFKSDRKPLSDTDLLETVVCLANGQGGVLLIGVEDDGTVTGLHAEHRTRPELLAAFVANRVIPPLAVEAAFVNLAEGTLAVITVPAARQPVATTDGKLVTRHNDAHGRPGCRPLYPYELAGWRADRGLADVSARPVPGTTWDDLDPLEFARLRRLVEENRGDGALLELSDQEIARALGLVLAEGTLSVTLTGLLLLGKEGALRSHVPTHEVAFQVLRGTDVAVNEFRRWPLLRAHEWLMEAVAVRNEEQELMVDGFRVGVPRYDRRGLREAVNNALIHRDYTRLGAVHVQLHDDHVLVANPGGFVMGVHAGNLLVATPRPRNPLLADAFKRVGLVERTGRGVSIIYAGQLQNGRRPPDYDRSTEASVAVVLDSGPADLAFVENSIRAGKRLGKPLTVPELLILWQAWVAGEAVLTDAIRLTQRGQSEVLELLRQLQRDSLLSIVGGTEHSYRPGPGFGTRATGVAPRPPFAGARRQQVEDQVIVYVQEHGRVRRGEVEGLTGLSEDQVYRLLKRLVKAGRLERVGRGQGAYYRLANQSEEPR